MVLGSIGSGLTSCNFPYLPYARCSRLGNPKNAALPHNCDRFSSRIVPSLRRSSSGGGLSSKPCFQFYRTRFLLQRTSFSGRESSDGSSEDDELAAMDQIGGDGEEDWTTSVLLFLLWGALMFYVTQLAPDQTPSTDIYFLQKLLNLKGDDGFQMNQVLVALWYIMGLYPFVYSMLLLPSARSSRSKVPVWPFLMVSFFAGAYGLIPYFVLWKPPPPPVMKEELQRWPLNFLESKITAAVVAASGIGLIAYAGLASGEDWTEFFQYFRQSKFIHATCLDFSLLSAFSAFWVFNDMTVRKWYEKGSWLLPLALIPFAGPAIYLLLRPEIPVASSQASSSLKAEKD
ncbi:uncharacterized protein LOC144713095 [Wolffia australiana]